MYVITKVPSGAREVNYVAKRKDAPHLPGVKGRADVFVPVPANGTSGPEAFMIPFVPAPDAGALLRAKAGHPRFKEGSLWICLGETPKGIKVAQFGGDGGRYYTSVSAKSFDVVAVENVIVG